MMRPLIIPENVAGFSDYFRLNAPTDEVLAELGYAYETVFMDWPRTEQMLPFLPLLATRLENALTMIAMNGETARREFLIAPVLFEVALHLQARLRVEYTVFVSPRLKGSLDYLLQQNEQLLVIEAKETSLTRGFKQLAAELIAVDQWTDSESPYLYGAISFGEIWQFGVLERERKRILHDQNTYSVPSQLEDTVRILLAMLTNEGEPKRRTM